MASDRIEHDVPTRPAGRRTSDHGAQRWIGTRDLLLAALADPWRRAGRLVPVLAAVVVLAELVGFVARRACAAHGCAGAATSWAARLDMDALGSVPRGLITVLLAAVSLLCLVAVLRAGRHGAALWWATLAAGAAVLTWAKHTSIHSVVESRLAGLLPGTDVQLGFVVVSALGLLVVVTTARWVRRDTRTSVTTWLALYAVAAVGLAAVTLAVAPLGPLVSDVSTLVEETAEGVAAVGLLGAVRCAISSTGRRGPVTAPATGT